MCDPFSSDADLELFDFDTLPDTASPPPSERYEPQTLEIVPGDEVTDRIKTAAYRTWHPDIEAIRAIIRRHLRRLRALPTCPVHGPGVVSIRGHVVGTPQRKSITCYIQTYCPECTPPTPAHDSTGDYL